MRYTFFEIESAFFSILPTNVKAVKDLIQNINIPALTCVAQLGGHHSTKQGEGSLVGSMPLLSTLSGGHCYRWWLLGKEKSKQ